jgi:hypothetical protein
VLSGGAFKIANRDNIHSGNESGAAPSHGSSIVADSIKETREAQHDLTSNLPFNIDPSNPASRVLLQCATLSLQTRRESARA